MKKRREVAIVALAVGVLSAVGCSGGKETFAGRITLDGQPLPDAYVLLIADDPALGGPFLDKTDSDGQYSLGPIGDSGDGVPPGQYRLRITTAHSEAGDETAVIPPERVPEPYSRGVEFTVPDGGPESADFALTSQ